MKNKNKKSAAQPSSSKPRNTMTYKPLKKQKKIKKKKQKKQTRIMNHFDENYSHINNFIDENSIYFSQEKSSILQQWRNFSSHLDMMEVLSRSNNSIFKDLEPQMIKQQGRRYLQKITKFQVYKYKQILLTNNQNKSILIPFIQYKDCHDQKTFLKNIQILTKNDEYLFKNRAPLIAEITQFIYQASAQLSYQNIDIPKDNLQLIFLCKILKKIEKDIRKNIEKIEEHEDPLFEIRPIEKEIEKQAKKSAKIPKKYKNMSSTKLIQPEVPILQDQFIKWLAIKNVQKSLNDETDIDFYNYHKALQACQDNRYYDKTYIPITKLQEFQNYIKNRIPKKTKPPMFNLKTPCSACFSSFSQLENPIVKCKECPIRIHKYCQKQTTRCQRCKYCRTSNEQKSKTGYCYICKRDIQKGLLVVGVSNSSPHYYAHTFCLYINKKWTVQDGQVKGHYVKPQQTIQRQCKVCKIKEGLFFNCTTCNQPFHGMCAYLHGYQFRFKRKDTISEDDYTIEINCCKTPQFIERRSIQRQFKLNFQKIVFKRSRQLLNYIQKKQQPQKISKKRALRVQVINENNSEGNESFNEQMVEYQSQMRQQEYMVEPEQEEDHIYQERGHSDQSQSGQGFDSQLNQQDLDQ